MSDEVKTSGDPYRVGHHIPTNLYRGDDPIGHACDPKDAKLIVDALNLWEETRKEAGGERGTG